MKDLLIVTGGHPGWNNLDKRHLREMITETAKAQAAMFGDSFLMTNTVITVNPAPGLTTCPAGWMCYKGEPCAFDAQSISTVTGQTLYWVPVTSYAAEDPVTYADTTSKNPHVIKKVQLQYAASPPADSVDNSLAKWPEKQIIDKVNGDWLQVNSAGFTQATNWNTTSNAWMRRTAAGEYQFKGQLFGTPGAVTSTLVLTTPSGLYPSRVLRGTVPLFEGFGSTYFEGIIELNTAGEMRLRDSANFPGDVTIYFDGLRMID